MTYPWKIGSDLPTLTRTLREELTQCGLTGRVGLLETTYHLPGFPSPMAHLVRMSFQSDLTIEGRRVICDVALLAQERERGRSSHFISAGCHFMDDGTVRRYSEDIDGSLAHTETSGSWEAGVYQIVQHVSVTMERLQASLLQAVTQAQRRSRGLRATVDPE